MKKKEVTRKMFLVLENTVLLEKKRRLLGERDYSKKGGYSTKGVTNSSGLRTRSPERVLYITATYFSILV